MLVLLGTLFPAPSGTNWLQTGWWTIVLPKELTGNYVKTQEEVVYLCVIFSYIACVWSSSDKENRKSPMVLCLL